MNLNEVSIKAKLATTFATLSALVLLVSAVSVNALNDSDKRFSGFVNGINERTEMAEAVRNAVNDRAMAVRNLVLATQKADVDIEKEAVLSAEARVESSLKQFNAMIDTQVDVSPRGLSLAGEITRIESLYRPVALEIDRLAVNNERDAAIADINTKCRPLLAALIKVSNEFVAVARERAAIMIRESQDQFVSQRRMLIGISLASIIMALVAGLLITRGLLRALGSEPTELSRVTQRVAQGDLRPIDGGRNAPAASVLASMGEMQSSLVKLIDQVRSSGASIATGASEIASGNVDLSSRTEEQAAALQETAASMEELTAAVTQNSKGAQRASDLASTASSIAQKGDIVVGRVVATMEEISNSSSKIADITGIIESIAFQTNILALNAAVEAARAGEQGKGFAVVASEVRSLAQRSSSAAKDIKSLIATSGQKVLDGSALAHDAGKTMTEVMDAIARVTTIMQEIALASREQSKGIEQVNQAITQMDQVTQQNAALVEEAAAASQSLEDQGRQLNASIAFFQLEAP